MISPLRRTQGSFAQASLVSVVLVSLLLTGCAAFAANSRTSGPLATALTACHATTADLLQSAHTEAIAPSEHLSGVLHVDGSPVLAPLFQRAGLEFDRANATTIQVSDGGSGVGFQDVLDGAAQIGLTDAFQGDKGVSGLTDHQVAVIAYTLVVNRELAGKVDNLTTDDIQRIFSFQVTNWSQIGGPDEAITLIQQTQLSAVRVALDRDVLSNAPFDDSDITQEDDASVLQIVSQTPGAIAYVSTDALASGGISQAVVPLCIDGYRADRTDIDAGHYQFWNIEHAYTKGAATGAAKALLEYVESDQVQTQDLPAFNLFQLTAIQASALKNHSEAGAPAPELFYPRQ